MLSNYGVVVTSKKGEIIAYNDFVENHFEKIPSTIQTISKHIPNKEESFHVTKLDIYQTNQNNKEDINHIYLIKPPKHSESPTKDNKPELDEQHKLDSKTMQQILDMSFDEIFVVDKNGCILFVNEAAKKHYGIKATDLVGKTVYHFDKQGLWEPTVFPIVLKEKKRITMLQNTSFGKTLLVTANPVFDRNHEIVMVVENARDITEMELLRQHLNEEKSKSKKYQSHLKEFQKRELDLSGFVIGSKKMEDLVVISQRVAATDSTVLILGETGVGKTLLAKLIHKLSQRADGPFITLNCAAIPDQLFESELFGYSPGAFTGASKTGKMGLIELADGGTLFLDEIAEISPQMQAKLLQVIEDRQFFNIGGKAPKKVDIRILTATNRDLRAYVKNGSFRKDLYYRLNVIELLIPPLRERPEEIILLAEHFLKIYNKKYGTNKYLSLAAQDMMQAYSWQGNVRELAHIIERLVITAPNDMIMPENLPHLANNIKKNEKEGEEDKETISVTKLMPLDHALEQVEKHLVTTAYSRFRSSYKVAEILDISQSKAYRLMRKFQCLNYDK
jgi:PAS domain S-box-containing protein